MPVLARAQATDSTPTLLESAPVLAAAPAQLEAPRSSSFWTPFKQLPGDFVGFFSEDTLRILGPAAVSVAALHHLDDDGIKMAMSRLQPTSGFTAGNIGGGTYAQLGGAFAVYSIASLTRSDRMAAVGGDLLRAQILTQGMVQIGKLASRRSRPDDSNNASLPSGHTASTFATATVLQRHFGWKVGVPAYAAGAYVAASRMSANKHHLSDVVLGAAFGIAAGRTVTVGRGNARFDVGVSPSVGGGAVTFTKKQN